MRSRMSTTVRSWASRTSTSVRCSTSTAAALEFKDVNISPFLGSRIPTSARCSTSTATTCRAHRVSGPGTQRVGLFGDHHASLFQQLPQRQASAAASASAVLASSRASRGPGSRVQPGRGRATPSRPSACSCGGQNCERGGQFSGNSWRTVGELWARNDSSQQILGELLEICRTGTTVRSQFLKYCRRTVGQE